MKRSGPALSRSSYHLGNCKFGSLSSSWILSGNRICVLPYHRRKGILRPLCDLERLVCRLRESTHSCRSNQRQAQVESRSLPQLSSSSHDQLERLESIQHCLDQIESLDSHPVLDQIWNDFGVCVARKDKSLRSELGSKFLVILNYSVVNDSNPSVV